MDDYAAKYTNAALTDASKAYARSRRKNAGARTVVQIAPAAAVAKRILRGGW
jgi:hypothetical protein